MAQPEATLADVTGSTPAQVRAPLFTAEPQDPLFDASLDNLWPYAGDPHLGTTDAGLIVSYRGKPEVWGGPTVPIFAATKKRLPDGTIVPHEIGKFAQMDEASALEALGTAEKAWNNGLGEWPTRTQAERTAVMKDIIDEMAADPSVREQIYKSLGLEIGKDEAGGATEYDRTLKYFYDSFADALKLIEESKQVHTFASGDKIYRKIRTPYGITLVMGPSNYPWNEGFGTTAFVALLTGNPVIYKAPRLGQTLVQTVLHFFAKRLPAGIFNVISGDGKTIITPIMKKGTIATFAFIGSNTAASRIAANHPHVAELRIIAGLGSKNIMAVLPGADLDQAAKDFAGNLGNRGERCTSTARAIVHESIAAEFAGKVARFVEPRKLGLPWQPGVSDPPFADSETIKRIVKLTQNALAKGAQILNAGGGRHNDSFIRPPVLFPVTRDMDIATAEVFGPALGILTFANPLEVVDYAASLDSHQQFPVYSAPGDREALQLMFALQNVVRESRASIPAKRHDDQDPNYRFAARREIPLGVRAAIEAFTGEFLAITPNHPAWRERLETMTDAELGELARKYERVNRKDAAGNMHDGDAP